MVALFLCAFLMFSCSGSSGVISETTQFEQTDPELQRIAEDARNTISSFFLHLGRKGAEEQSFCVKYSFDTAADSRIAAEQIWLTGVHFKNGNYYGVLANNPQFLDGRKKGDTVIFSADSVTDWMYVRDGKIIGGYSIKYLLEKIPEDQRNENQRNLLNMF